MLDGAGASTFLDLIDERNQQQITINSSNKDIYKEGENSNKDIPFTNIARDKIRNDKKNIVFIDSAVEDYETITSSFKENTEFYLINANEDGFKRINEILKDRENIDALHLIGHGSSGQILFGNAFLNNDTIDSYQTTLTSIGQSLTTSGDILFYGCNVASTDQGEILIKKISEITKADIAASDDITGKSGDWDLEKEEGFIDVKKLKVRHYDHSLDTLTSSGILSNSKVNSISTTVDMLLSTETKMGLHSNGIYSHISSPDSKFALVLERSNVSVASGKIISNIDIDTTDTGLNEGGSGSSTYINGDSNQTASESMIVNSYLMAFVGNATRLSSSDFGSVVFDGEIVGIFFDQEYTRGQTINGVQYYSSSFSYDMRSNNSGGSSPTHSGNYSDSDGGRVLENPNFYNSNRTSDSVDWVSVGDYGSGTNNYLSFGAVNNSSKTGDYIRVIVKVNVDPSAVADTGYIQEGKTLTVANSGSADAGTTTGKNTGDITDNDTDANNDSLTVTHIQHSGAGSSTSVTNVTYNHGSATSVNGTYGTLTIGSDGSYQYVASSDINNLDAGEANITDVFTYTVSDGNGGTDTETLTINVIASQDLTARNDTGTVNEDATLEVDDGDNLTPVTAATYDPSPFSIRSQESSVQGFTFNNDGTKMFITGTSGEDINEYNLSTAFDVSTATFNDINGDGTGFSVGDQDTMPIDVSFNNDGTKMFVLGYRNRDVNEYTLTTGFDVSTASFVDSFSVGSQESENHGLTFNNDGTKMFVVGAQGDDINEYTLSTGFDVSTASYTQNFSVSAQDTTPISLTFNNDGTKMFVVGNQGDDINEYTLSTGFDVSTASFVGEFSVSSQDPNPYDIEFNNDGTKLFMLGRQAGDISEYSLTTPFSLVNISGEHSGDVINTSSTDNYDTDPDSDTLTVTAIRVGSSEGSGTAGSVGSALDGTYGQLTIAANGSYTYVANKDAADALDPGDVVTDTFNYTVSDGQGETDIAVLTITVNGINDTPVADAETGSVDISQTLTVTDGTSDLLHGDTDADASASLRVSSIVATTASGSATAVNPGTAYNSGYTSVTGSKGTLRVGADGTYQYIAGSSTGTDVFTYTLSDGTATHTATLTITVSSSNNAPSATNDTDAVNEDATITESSGSELLVADDTDADSDALTVTQIAVTGASNSSVAGSSTYNSNGTSKTGTYGTLVIGANGTYTYVADQSAADDLDAGDTATDSFTYTVSDGTATDTATLIITVTGVNDVPTAADKTITTNEDTAHVFSASDFGYTDADDDDALVSVKITGLEDAGALQYYNGSAWVDVTENQVITATDIGNNKLRFNPAANENGSSYTTFDFTVNDGDADSASANTITVNVTAVNDAPVADNETNSVNEDATITVTDGSSDVLHGDTDTENDALTVTQIAVTGASNSSVAGSSTYNSNGTSKTGTYGTLVIGANGTYTYVADQSAADDLDAGDTATDSFTYTVSDGTATDTATLIITVTGVNDVPTAADKTITTNEDTAHVFSASDFGYTDADDDDALVSVKITGLEDAGALQYYNGSAWVDVTENQVITATDIGNNKLRFNPAANENGSSYTTFDFTVNDGDADSASANTITVNVTAVNDAPVADNETNSVNEDATITVTDGSSDVLHGDTDTENDALTVTQIAVTGASNSSVAGSSTYNSNGTSKTGTYGTLVIGANGTYTYVADQSAADDLDAGDTATDSFTYTVSDGTATDTATLIITVTGVNDVPTAADKTITTNEDTAHVFSASDFGYTDADDDDALVSVKITGLEDAGALQYYNGSAWVDVTENQVITATDIGNNKLRFNPAANENGSSYTTFDFTVNDGDADSASANTITVNVTAVNDAPVADNETNSVNEDATITVTDGSSDVLHGDTDTENDALTVTQIAVTGASNSSVAGSSTYNSNGTSKTGTYGTLVIGANGTYTYVADQSAADDLDAGDTATDSFTYTVSDGTATDTATLIITVTGVNDVPTAADKTITTNEDTAHVFSASDFGYTDADDDDALVSVKITGLEDAGALQYYNGSAWVDVTENQVITATDIGNNKLRFNPAANENGSSYTTFDFTVNDGDADSASANTITVNVTAVNDAPVATDDASSVTEDSNVRVRANGDDLLNDDSDTENDSLSVTLIKPLNGSNTSISSGSSTTITGTYGELTVNSNGAYNYKANQDAADTLDTGESAKEKFVYTVSDGNGGTDTGILTITINGVEDNPNAVKDNVSLNISDSLTLTGNAITNDIDPDDSLTIVGCGQGKNPNNGTAKTVGTAFDSNYGQMIINTDGSYTFVAVSNIEDLLDPGQSVIEKFYYTISDGNSTSTAMIEVTVQRDDVVQELTKKEQKQIKKQIINDRANQESTIRLENIPSTLKSIEQTVGDLDSISSTKKLSFNEGIKLVDLVAETGSLTTTDGSLDKVRAKEKDGQLNLKFKVSTDLGNQVVRYEGVMPDGSKLPDWIKVDRQTGKTTTNIPEGVEQVDFIIVTTDQQNNKKEIAVSIDPKEIKADKSIFKQAKKQNASLSVDQSGNVNIVNTNESGEVNQTETKNLNANEKQNSSNNIITQDLNLDNTNDIKNIIDTIKSDQVYQLQTINNGETLEIKIPETLIGSFEKTKLVLKDGSAIPDWVEFNPITGEINANPPEDVDKLEFKLIIERDGEIIVKDLVVDVEGDDNAQILDDIEDTKFIAFKDQLNKEHDNWEEYGSNIINRL